MSFLRRNWKVVMPVVVVGAAGLAWLAFGYFGVQFLFIDDKVNEAAPAFSSGAVVVTDDDQATDDDGEAQADQATDDDGAAQADQTTDDGAAAQPGTEDETPATEAQQAPVVETLSAGEFIDRAHPTSGAASVLTDGSSQRFLRFENFETDNGPDLNVYLVPVDATSDEGLFDDDFVDLGNLKGNIGPQNYEIPPDVDLEVYDTVVIWCVRFAVAFGAADLG